MQAVIVTGGKQYSVKEGDVIYVEKLNAEADATVTFDQVLAVVDGENSKFGAPVVAGASVEAKVLKNGKAKKVVVFKYRPKKDSKSIRRAGQSCQYEGEGRRAPDHPHPSRSLRRRRRRAGRADRLFADGLLPAGQLS